MTQDHKAAFAVWGAEGQNADLLAKSLLVEASHVDAVVEELFPIEALTDPHAFYCSGGDGDDLWRRVTAVLQRAGRSGADRDVDVVPTSRYRLLSPSAADERASG